MRIRRNVTEAGDVLVVEVGVFVLLTHTHTQTHTHTHIDGGREREREGERCDQTKPAEDMLNRGNAGKRRLLSSLTPRSQAHFVNK